MTHVHVITGSFGAGKTTAIRRLMAGKPEHELWVVILNEFTDAGLDALNVAQASRGAFDVRLVTGGCLCCVGELEFGKQLRDLLRQLKPVRLLIEPSGAGHAADIVDELGLYERQGALQLDSVVCLVDALDAVRLSLARDSNEWSQIQAADVLLLSKADLAGDAGRAAFADIVAVQYPVKRFVGSCTHGELPPEATQAYVRAPVFSLMSERDDAVPGSVAEAAAVTQPFSVGGLEGSETQVARLGYCAVNWILPQELTFSRVALEARLSWMLEAYQGWLRRFKAVFRTGPGPSWQVQSHGRGLEVEDSAYRRDSRIEIVLGGVPGDAFLEEWRTLLRDGVA